MKLCARISHYSERRYILRVFKNGTGHPNSQKNNFRDLYLSKRARCLFVGLFVCFSLGCSLDYGVYDLGSLLNKSDRIDCVNYDYPIGTECSGGALYLGAMPTPINPSGSRYMIMPGGCDGSTDNPACSGDDDLETKMPWGPIADTSGAEIIAVWPLTEPSKESGDASVRGIISSKGGLGAYPAAKYCNDMIFGGYKDWYLPSKSEMAYIYCKAIPTGTPQEIYPSESPNCETYGGKEGILSGFGDRYWTSTEGFDNVSWAQLFSTGVQSNNTLKELNHNVRCIRRIE